ncbi:MAG TPA: hypothetical protein VG347_01480, partial [Verrucomicrobiae bacterium]|nr:hypothetical protein [Verrucomicrobiae bacterium]
PQFSDPSLPPKVVLSFGRTGSGKTTFCFRFLANVMHPQELNLEPAACIFIFDWKLEASQRMGVPSVTTEAGCERALASRVVCFNPHVMFPGDQRIKTTEGEWVMNDDKQAFRWFCGWVFSVCQRGPGPKWIYLDELKQFASKFYIPPELGRIVRMGRSENLGLITSTQYPRDYHADIRGAVTEWVCFSCTERAELDAVRDYFPGVDVAATLPKGHFVSVNRDTQATLRGQLW